MRSALCKRPTWPQSVKCCRHFLYSAKYSRCSHLRPGLIVSSKLLKQFDQVCTKRVSLLAETSDGYILTFVHIQHKVQLSLWPTWRHMEVQLHSFLTSALDQPVWSNSRSSCFFFQGTAPPRAHSKRGGEGAGPNSLGALKTLSPPGKFNDLCKLFT
jgi:hypothetical protein